MDVRAVGELELVRQRIPQRRDGLEVVEAKGIGGAHGGDNGGDLPALRQHLSGSLLQPDQVNLVVVGGGHRHQVPGADAEPAGDVGGAVVPGVGHQDDGISGHAVVDGIRTGLLQPQLHSVERRAGAAEREHAARPFRVVADEPRGHAHGLHFGQGHQPAVFVPGDVGIVQRGQQDPDDAGDGGRRDDVLLGAGVAE